MAEYEMPKVGDLIAGKYRLEQVAGEGGMGVVYAAEHVVLRQRVAVKVLLPDAAASELVIERFAREAQAAARIQSEHVARVMDAGSTATGAPFLVMEYLEGCDLEELLLVDGPLALPEVVDYLLQACEALAHAHAVGLVHRDIKPANLFLACRPDGSNAIKVLDFGISKAMRSTPEQKVLTGQAVLGSPVYMSPEQLRNAKDIDARADIWSLGVVAYELLCGKVPFDGDGVGEIFAAILEKDPAPLHAVNWRLPPEISAVVAKCLQRKAADRWDDAAQLARALKPFGTGAWTGVVERAEQVLSRAKLLTRPETPSEARRVVDALNAVAERARTSAGIAAPQPPVSAPMSVAAAPAAIAPVAAPRRRVARWVPGAAAVAFVVVAAVTFTALRSGRSTVDAARPLAALTAAAADEGQAVVPGEPADGREGAEPPDPAQDGATMVMDLPDTPGQTGAASRSRNAKPGKPQRPKFLNTRE